MSKKNKMVGSLLQLVRSYNRDNFHVFFSYSGHIDCVYIHVCPGGWTMETEDVYAEVIYLKEADYYKTIASVKRFIDKCYLANKNGLDMPVLQNSNGMPF